MKYWLYCNSSKSSEGKLEMASLNLHFRLWEVSYCIWGRVRKGKSLY